MINFEELIKLGEFTQMLKKESKNLVKENVKVSEIINFLEKKIFENNYKPAFPATISVNSIAAHYTIFDETTDFELKKGDVVKVDFGVENGGWITDNAFTIEIETNNYEKQIKANEECLNELLMWLDKDKMLFEIGKKINDCATKNGFDTIHNLMGHQIDKYNLHAGLFVPNYDNKDKTRLKDGMILAIEPFFTTGQPFVKDVGNSNILHLIEPNRQTRDIIAKKVLDYIKKNYLYLPFSKRWLSKDLTKDLFDEKKREELFSTNKLNYAINRLKNEGIIKEYEILESVDKSIITQFEETVIFNNGIKFIITNTL